MSKKLNLPTSNDDVLVSVDGSRPVFFGAWSGERWFVHSMAGDEPNVTAWHPLPDASEMIDVSRKDGEK